LKRLTRYNLELASIGNFCTTSFYCLFICSCFIDLKEFMPLRVRFEVWLAG
jgi:hypothetical protein